MKAFLKDEYVEIGYSTLLGDTRFPLNFRLLESGMMGADTQLQFSHPKPDHNRIFLVLSGTLKVLMNNREMMLAANSIYLLPSYQSFDITYPVGSKIIYLHFTVHDIISLDIFRDIDTVQVLRNDYLYTEIKNRYFKNELMDKIRWQSSLFQVVCNFITPQILSQLNAFHDSRKYHDLLLYIQQHCHPNLTVSQLSKYMHISQSALSKGFKKQIGFSIKHYIQQLLMQKACRLLTGSDESVMNIAYALGYNDPYYFFRVFKKHMQETPLQYRKASRQFKLSAVT